MSTEKQISEENVFESAAIQRRRFGGLSRRRVVFPVIGAAGRVVREQRQLAKLQRQKREEVIFSIKACPFSALLVLMLISRVLRR